MKLPKTLSTPSVREPSSLAPSKVAWLLMVSTSKGLVMMSRPPFCTTRLPGVTRVCPFIVSDAVAPSIVMLPLPLPRPVAAATVTGALMMRPGRLPLIWAGPTSWMAPVVLRMAPLTTTFPCTWQLNAPRLSAPPLLTVSDLAAQVLVTVGWAGAPAGISTSSARPGTLPVDQLPGVLQSLLTAPVQVTTGAAAGQLTTAPLVALTRPPLAAGVGLKRFTTTALLSSGAVSSTSR